MTEPHPPDLVHHHCVALALVLVTHATTGDAAKLVTIGLGLAVRVKLVKHQEHHGVTAGSQGSDHVLAGVTGG